MSFWSFQTKEWKERREINLPDGLVKGSSWPVAYVKKHATYNTRVLHHLLYQLAKVDQKSYIAGTYITFCVVA